MKFRTSEQNQTRKIHKRGVTMTQREREDLRGESRVFFSFFTNSYYFHRLKAKIISAMFQYSLAYVLVLNNLFCRFSNSVLSGIYSFHASASAYTEYWNNSFGTAEVSLTGVIYGRHLYRNLSVLLVLHLT